MAVVAEQAPLAVLAQSLFTQNGVIWLCLFETGNASGRCPLHLQITFLFSFTMVMVASVM